MKSRLIELTKKLQICNDEVMQPNRIFQLDSKSDLKEYERNLVGVGRVGVSYLRLSPYLTLTWQKSF
jgi:hypothetical protein